MHSFLARNYVANTEHEPESRELLRRIITYYQKVYVGRQPNGEFLMLYCTSEWKKLMNYRSKPTHQPTLP